MFILQENLYPFYNLFSIRFLFLLEIVINETQKKLEERMKRYDEYIKSIFISAHSDSYQPSDKDSDYFINEYSEKFIGRNSDNIKNRLELYRKYLGEQDN